MPACLLPASCLREILFRFVSFLQGARVTLTARSDWMKIPALNEFQGDGGLRRPKS